MAHVDIIITHYNEPWEVGKKLFDSLAIQECYREEDVCFTLVQDGEKDALDWETLLMDYPFYVNIVTLKEHRGMAAARNAGIENTKADWLMFMDFDDMFADVATMSMMTRLFPVTDDVDIIWSKYLKEVYDYGRYRHTTFNRELEIDYGTIGKIYRRGFLDDKCIRFSEELPEYCNIMFNTVAVAETYAFKIAVFNVEFFPFFKKFRTDGAFSTESAAEKRVAHIFDRDLLLAEEMQRRGKTTECHRWMVRAIADVYYSLQKGENDPDEYRGVTEKAIQYWNMYRDGIMAVPETDLEVILDEAQTEAMTYVQEYYNYFHKEYYLQNDMITFADFVRFLDTFATQNKEQKQEDVIIPERVSTKTAGYDDKVVVYCGTREVYIGMIASVKSLLATTPVVKVYFLIEDDAFPYELPDIVECVNVKGRHPFDTNGPNFENAWTYMCLMRTVYPEMFKQYRKVLSLDVDVVITEDVSKLWDIDLSDYYFAGVLEEGRVPQDSQDIYANFGVIMMNLDKLRRDGMGQRLVNAVNTEKFGCPEQDAFNKLCKGFIYRLPNDYNVTVYSHITGEPLKERILHYAGLKYWKHFGPVKKYYNLEWDEIMRMQEALHG